MPRFTRQFVGKKNPLGPWTTMPVVVPSYGIRHSLPQLLVSHARHAGGKYAIEIASDYDDSIGARFTKASAIDS